MRKWLLASAVCSLAAAMTLAAAAPTKKPPADDDDPDAADVVDPSPANQKTGATTAPATKPTSKPSNATAGAGVKPWPKPPVPALPPEEMLKSFQLPPGLRIELVASEPMVQHPVAMTFDPDGRLYVVEMRGYMPDTAGRGEDKPVGRVSLLEDTDGDGRMDKSTVFLDQLVLPRAVGLARDGVLVAAPPNVLFCRDTNGDGVADEQTPIASDYGGRGNPEHQANGLMPGLDNWIYSANYSKRFRYAGDKWLADPVVGRGQWGITRDDQGRLFANTNSTQLLGELYTSQYLLRNPYFAGSGANVSLAADGTVYPATPTIANRGYGNIVKDGMLQKFTGACGPAIYRGELLGAEFQGNAFICEPVGCLVRRSVLKEGADGKITGKNAYDGREFLASTNERFRPVNAYTGPEGALYVVDMHHGLIQHKVFLTDFARRGYLERTLEQHLGMGRIYRIVPEGADAKSLRKPKLSKLTGPQLVEQLSHANGWVRDTAQRLIVDRQDATAVAPLRKLVASAGGTPLARVHALWALEGLRKADLDTLTAAMADKDPQVRATAVRVSEQLLSNPAYRQEVIPEVMKLAGDADPKVRLQFTFTAGEVGTPEALDAMAAAVTAAPGDALLRDAVISGLRGREDDFLDRLLAKPEWAKSAKGKPEMLTGLAQAVFSSAKVREVIRLLDIAAAQPAGAEWRTSALLDGVPAAAKAKKLRKPIQTDEQPGALVRLEQSADKAVRKKVDAVAAQVIWPGKPGYKPPVPVVPLTPEQQAQFERGKVVYAAICTQCHQPDGEGQAGLAPPLVDSDWVLGSERRLARIVLHGLTGQIKVDDRTWNLEMPGLKTLPDDQVADVLTYVRREWEHGGSPVKVDTVKQVRAAAGERDTPYTVKELNEIKD